MIVTNTPLESAAKQNTASHVGVPSVAMNGAVVFYTGNWYAALSRDGGHEFRYVSPSSLATPSDQSRSLWSQVVTYLPSIDTFVWLLQYGPSTGNNLHRVAFAKTKDVLRGQWRLFDITPEMLAVPEALLSFPDLAAGSNYLYVTTNFFAGGPQGPAGSAVLRIPFSSLAKGEPLMEKFVDMEMFSFRVAQNCRETAFFAAHVDTATLALFSWPESESLPSSHYVPVARWQGSAGYESRCPDGRAWLDRADPRLTGATMAGSELWFAWSVDKGPNHAPNPHVRVARINSWDMSLIENISVADAESAVSSPALATNVDNDVAISYMIGGGPRFPSHVVGMLTNPRKQILVAAGERGPVPDPNTGRGEWGDYLTVRPVFPEGKLFVAAAYTLQGKGDGTRLDATPHCAIFGRSEAPTPASASS
jgi:hypothetical protein